MAYGALPCDDDADNDDDDDDDDDEDKDRVPIMIMMITKVAYMLLPLMMMPGPCNDKDLSDDDIMGGGGVR